ncbi:DUF2637 domain-containing protein [Streptomyces sp. CAU 1734]|uniref:DUF2637 domain-containing protein n=1 Tax=Streptomyces sp. CAU 1734 TaxID=3140360 RepID=UPI00326153BF
MAAMQLTRTHRILIAIVVTGAVIIAGIGFAGSYAAVRDLAERKGFGDFALVFPIGIDAGICVLLALDLLLTWMRIPFPLLRQTAWLLTIATIAFNGAASWPDPLGVGMHAVIPVLFVVSVEAARHAVGRIADITADKHMEGVRLTRWLLSPVPTFKLWRRMKLWELRSYEQVIKLEQDRLIYQARLQARFGRAWRRKAPIEALMPLRLAKYGVPLSETAAAGLAAAGVEPALLPPAPAPVPRQQPELVRESPKPPSLSKEPAEPGRAQLPPGREESADAGPAGVPVERRGASRQWAEEEWREEDRSPEYDEYGAHAPDPEESQGSPWFARQAQDVVYEGGYDPSYPADTRIADPDAPQVPTGSGDRMRPLGDPSRRPEPPRRPSSPEPQPEPEQLAEEVREFYEAAYPVFVTLSHELSDYPKAEHLDIHLADVHGITHPDSAALLRQAMPAFKQRIQTELVDDHIA